MASPREPPRMISTPFLNGHNSAHNPLGGEDNAHNSRLENPFIPAGVAGTGATEPWSIKHIGINCISSAVNDPTGKYPDVMVSKNLPIVPPAIVPKVDASQFEKYYKSIAKPYPQFSKNHRITLRNFNSFLPEEPESQAELGSKWIGPVEHVIPAVYFSPDFDMDDAETFQAVLDSVPAAASSATLLQETLSYYLDLVEVRLVQQVSDRSTSFFSAMDILNDVHSEVTRACEQIRVIREEIASIDVTLALQGLNVVRLRQRRKNLLTLYRYVKLISEVNQAKATVRLLLSQSDYADALDLSMIAQHMLETELTGLRCFNSLSVELSEMRSSIEKVMRIELSSGLMKFVTGPFEDSSKPEVTTEINPEKFEQTMSPLFVGLVRVGKLDEYLENYKDSLVRKVKHIVKHKAESMIDGYSASQDSVVVVGSTDQLQAPPVSLVQQLRELSSDAFLTMITSVYDVLLNILEQLLKVNEQTERILRIQQNGSDEGSSLFSKDLLDRVTVSNQELVISIHELAHIRCAKLLELRKDVNLTTPFKEFAKLYQATTQFVESSEALVSRKRALGLHGVMTSQVKAYLDHFHQEKVSIMASLIENESWGQTNVPVEFQRLVDNLFSRTFGTLDPSLQQPTENQEEPDDVDPDQESETVVPTTNSPQPSPQSPYPGATPESQPQLRKFIVLGRQKFYIVTCALMFLKFLGEYMNFFDQLPSHEQEVARRVVEIIHVFNSRTCQMLLGGGALAVSGLKNIKTRHLAFASQSLGLLLTLIPSMKEKVRLRTPAKQQVFLGEFDRVLKDILDHQNEIHTKLADVIPTRLESSKTVFREMDWNEALTKNNTPSQFAKGLVADVNALHKVIARYLPKDTCRSILEHVYQQINRTLEVEIISLELDRQEAKERMVAEIRYIVESLEPLGGLGGLGDRMAQVAQSLPLTVATKKREIQRAGGEDKKKSWFG